MVSFNVYRSTASGAYVEGVCLATDEKPITGIANGSILYAVDPTDGSTTRYMFDQSTATWIDAACPCSGGGSGSGGGEGGGSDVLFLSHVGETSAISASFNDLLAAAQAHKIVVLSTYEMQDDEPYATYDYLATLYRDSDTQLYSAQFINASGTTTYNASAPDEYLYFMD